ncbi:MAG TPA: GtrA family protein [Actinocrinis sp.]|uniref:GtrA family protein n=1 Tax=Actinocrinis sp. TaxID=1920516 RepID=UPI002DDCFF24|nr:GtrA family protein [Actinocrinis sp.]HEV2347950.1 GtrA family protein [Actinocrinis sp.]
MAALQATYARLRRATHELAKFGTIGLIALVVNMLVTNLCWQAIPHKPVVGSIVGTVVATVVAYLGNRFWTYKDRDSIGRTRELVLFFAVNGIGMLIETVPLAVSQYVMHFDGTLANNVAKYVFGLPLGMVFRLWTYRTWIFPKADPALAEAQYQFSTGEPLPTSQLPMATSGPRHKRSGSGSLMRATSSGR